VDAIVEATLQVLLDVGKERLTTTRVAHRAGVSVGTLYQYFPNKSALLRAALRRHFDVVLGAVERVCREQAGNTLEEMATALIHGFLAAKMRDGKRSVALYAVSADVEGVKLMRSLEAKANKAIVAMLTTSSERLNRDPQLVASILQASMSGVSRRLLESGAREKDMQELRAELVLSARSYLRACATRE
jgi:AcrR family transcriptional regulator